MNKYGLCGAQRVGKTTLAKESAEVLGLQFIQTTTRSVFARLGKDPKAQYPIHERLDIQYAIFDELNEGWVKYDNAIFDRTPLDVMAYMEADVLRDFPNESETIDKYMKHRERCFKATQLFDALILVQPGIAIVEVAGAAPGTIPYMEHFNTLVLAYMEHFIDTSRTFSYILPRNVTDLQKRIDIVSGVKSRCKLWRKAACDTD